MKLDKGQKITFGILGILIFSMFLFRLYFKKNINDNIAYTICKIDNYMSGSNGTHIYYYYYYVDGIKYTDSNSHDNDYDAKVGEYYKVKYSSENPSFSEIIQSDRITDSAMIVDAGLKLPKRRPRRNQFQEY